MKKTVLFGQVWHIEDNADPRDWAETDPDRNHAVSVKKSTTRTVVRIKGSSGKEYFIKHYVRKGVLDLLFPKAMLEFRSYVLLKENGIPTAEYAGWTSGRDGSILVSPALGPEWISFPRFWHMHGDRKIREELIRRIGGFLALFLEKKLFHPDFHTGNLMVNSGTLELKSVDPGGIRHWHFPDDPVRMGNCFSDLRNGISTEEQAELLTASPLFGGDREKLLLFLKKSGERSDRRIRREWPRRQKQILSGTSKFASETAPGSWVRNSAWFAELPLPPQEKMQTEIMSCEEGEQLWLESFLLFLLGKDIKRVPVAFRKEGERCEISYLTDKQESLFYGFSEKK